MLQVYIRVKPCSGPLQTPVRVLAVGVCQGAAPRPLPPHPPCHSSPLLSPQPCRGAARSRRGNRSGAEVAPVLGMGGISLESGNGEGRRTCSGGSPERPSILPPQPARQLIGPLPPPPTAEVLQPPSRCCGGARGHGWRGPPEAGTPSALGACARSRNTTAAGTGCRVYAARTDLVASSHALDLLRAYMGSRPAGGSDIDQHRRWSLCCYE